MPKQRPTASARQLATVTGLSVGTCQARITSGLAPAPDAGPALVARWDEVLQPFAGPGQARKAQARREGLVDPDDAEAFRLARSRVPVPRLRAAVARAVAAFVDSYDGPADPSEAELLDCLNAPYFAPIMRRIMDIASAERSPNIAREEVELPAITARAALLPFLDAARGTSVSQGDWDLTARILMVAAGADESKAPVGAAALDQMIPRLRPSYEDRGEWLEEVPLDDLAAAIAQAWTSLGCYYVEPPWPVVAISALMVGPAVEALQAISMQVVQQLVMPKRPDTG